jgi:hypothetical protein
MPSKFPSRPRLRLAVVLLAALVLSSLSCSTIGSLWATPTPTITPSPTPTVTPSTTPTFTPSPTQEALLSKEERSEYMVILRYVSEGVRTRFLPVKEFLAQQGYTVTIDEGPSSIGDMDVILYGALSCNDAIDDLIILLHDKLALQDLDRVRFDSKDTSYQKKNIVIQIKDFDRFDPGL